MLPPALWPRNASEDHRTPLEVPPVLSDRCLLSLLRFISGMRGLRLHVQTEEQQRAGKAQQAGAGCSQAQRTDGSGSRSAHREAEAGF